MFMKNRTRNNLKRVYFSDEEIKIINEKMKKIGTENFSSYCRKMTVDGYVIKKDYQEIKDLIYEINKIGTNINQIAKNVNIDNKVQDEQLKEINNKVDDIWHILKSKISNQL